MSKDVKVRKTRNGRNVNHAVAGPVIAKRFAAGQIEDSTLKPNRQPYKAVQPGFNGILFHGDDKKHFIQPAEVPTRHKLFIGKSLPVSLH